MPKKQKDKNLEKKNILILGGGFAGVRTALDLESMLGSDPDYEIILIDRKDYHLYNSALYEAATTEHGLVEAKKVKSAVAIPLSKIFKKKKVKVFKAYIDSINVEGGMIITDSRILNYSYLVIALGSIADFYGIPSIEKFSYTLKSLEDAIMIRNRIEEIITKKEKARIVIGGAGYTGAEFAGELMNLIRHECIHHERQVENYEILVVEGATSFLPGLPDNVSKLVGDRLTQLGVKTRFSALITEAGADFININNKEKLSCDLLIWTGGVKSCRLPFNLDVERDRKDRTPTSEFLNLRKYPNIFLAGDNLCFPDQYTKKMVPQTAQEAIRQGSAVARNIFRTIKGKPLLQYSPGPTRFVIPVAGKYAIFYTKNIVITGVVGWMIRRLADLRYFLSILPFLKAIELWMFENKIFIKND